MWEVVNIGDVIETAIHKLGDKGDGIGKTKTGLVLIVKGAKVGQVVKARITTVKPTFCIAEIAEVLKEAHTPKPSSGR